VLAVSPVPDQEPDVYDMYPWDDSSPDRRRPAATRATDAVQIALDRRDNGGDAAPAVSTVAGPASQPPAAPAPQ
jgi:hypothetical protein